jgi:tetratricopeptide (TPR) repeat protein
VAVDRDKILQAAQKLVEKKRYDKAVVEYQKLVADDPKDVRTLLKIGDLYLKMEQYADAISTYEGVGQFYSAQGFHLKAIAVYKQIREIINKHAPGLEERFGHIAPKLAETYAHLGLISDALATYDEVATRYQRAGRERDAIDVFRKVVDLDPQSPLPHLRLAEAFMRVRDLDNALQRFGTAAEILLKLGRRDDALKVVERLLQHRADAKFARIGAEIYLDRGEPSDAMSALSKLQVCFKENPKDLETLALLARAFDQLGQPQKSIEVQKEAARIAKDAGRLDHFEALLEALLARAPDDEGVRQLVLLRAPPSLHAPAPASVPAPESRSIDVDVEDAVVVVEETDDAEADEIASSAMPFALRQSLPPPGGGAPTADPAGRARQILAQVDHYRNVKDLEPALALLFEGVDELPASRELREKLCDVLIEAGDQAEAVRQMLGFARWLVQSEDVDGAARLLDEILLLEPGEPETLAMLRELGYAVPAPEGAPEEAPPQRAGYDPNAPLPSYDLEEISAIEALSQQVPFIPGQLDDPFGASDNLDDPFGAVASAPLPSFPMEEEAHAAVHAYIAPEPPPFAFEQRSDAAHAVEVPAPRPSHRPAGEGGGPFDEDALEEVEFFATQGMFDEARGLLEEQLQRLPNHPLLLERLRELEEHAAAAQGGGSGTHAVPHSAPPSSSYSPEDRSFDIAASLDALDALDAGPPPEAAPQADPSQISVESLFEQFKAGVAQQISESDAATHYDLGVAYREMGLYPDAINEFRLSSRDVSRECVCHSMIGMIHRELGDVDAAIDAFTLGLRAQVKTREQELALTYEIGDCYEARRAPDQAVYYFQRVTRMEPGYADPRGSAAERVRRLEPAPAPAARPAMAVGAEAVDEFDAVLDEMLGGGKLP